MSDEAKRRSQRIQLLKEEARIVSRGVQNVEEIQRMRQDWMQVAEHEFGGNFQSQGYKKEVKDINERCNKGIDNTLNGTEKKLAELARERRLHHPNYRAAQFGEQKFNPQQNRATARARAESHFKSRDDNENER